MMGVNRLVRDIHRSKKNVDFEYIVSQYKNFGMWSFARLPGQQQQTRTVMASRHDSVDVEDDDVVDTAAPLNTAKFILSGPTFSWCGQIFTWAVKADDGHPLQT